MIEKSVLVTGGVRGIGRDLCLVLAKEGYKVVINYRKSSLERATLLKSEIEALGGCAALLMFDISNREECKTNIEKYLEENSVFYGVVLNAGIAKDNIFVAMDDEEWDSVLHTNLDGFYNVLRPIVMPMCKKRQGRVVVISSVSGVMGNKGQVNYSASKAGLIGAVKALALEVASRHITVNAVAPGIIETDMIEGLPLEEMIKMVPMKRLGKPNDVSALVSFLLSENSGYITKQVIYVNGGLI